MLRISQLLDPGSLDVVHQRGGLGVVIARGRIEGADVIVFCTGAMTSGGAIGGQECSLIAAAIEEACGERCPVIGLWHSGGAKLAEGVVAMDGIGTMFAAMVQASGQVLQLSVILGPAAGGAAYGAALTDLVIMSDGGRLFITGPDIVRSVTGERIDMNGLGGPEVHGRRSGVAHLVTDSDAAAFQQARNIVTLVTQRATSMPAVSGTKPTSGPSCPNHHAGPTTSVFWSGRSSTADRTVAHSWSCKRNGRPTSS